MLKIRLARVGKKKQPSYRVVVAESHFPRDGRFVEIVGIYNPRTEPTTFEVDADKVRGWLNKGGFLIVDDFLLNQWTQFERSMKAVLPNAQIVPLTVELAHTHVHVCRSTEYRRARSRLT